MSEYSALIESPNSIEKVDFRERIQKAQEFMVQAIANGQAKSVAPECRLMHFFTPIHPEYGCCQYAREIILPLDSMVIGKIHRHQHLNFIMTGKVIVVTEHGMKRYQWGDVFVSEVGLKRLVVAEEDTLWITAHLTKYNSEDDLDKIEEELISPTYKEIGLADSVREILGVVQ